ncbi:B12-binding domain-containing radical SAM protein [Desulfuromonas thiophila]|uniref:B12-binding domain-containing radical SAM protein n=1 Tax=Desulfuromonas thiophila TaxID=57664 RepID=UPI0024A8F9B1|nr:DUF4080 domain-containing protein [Desulfuromonas thiophila]
MVPLPRVLWLSWHVRPSPQAVALAAGSIIAALPESWRAQMPVVELYGPAGADAFWPEVDRLQPDWVAFSIAVWNHDWCLALARQLRQRFPRLRLLAGGPQVSARPDDLAALALFDVLFCGAGEHLFAEMIRNYLAGAPLPTLLRADGGNSFGPSPWLTQTLPLRSGLLWETARGCPFRCAYCYDGGGRHKVEILPLERLRQELRLFANGGVEQLWVLDSSFNVPTRRGQALLRCLLEEAPRLHYHLEAKAEYLDEAIVELLQQLSCSVQVGLQSIHPAVLQTIDRSLDAERFCAGLERLGNAGVTYGIDLIYGLPGDDYAGFCASVDAALSFQPNHLECFPLALLPGTRLAGQAEVLGLVAQPEPPYEIRVTASLSADELLRCRRLAAAIQLFYNNGRAMAYFGLLCEALQQQPASFLADFGAWLDARGQLLVGDQCAEPPMVELMAQQEAFVRCQFAAAGLTDLIPMAVDLIHFHRLWSDALLAADLPQAGRQTGSLHQVQLAAGVFVGQFHYAVRLYEEGWVDDLVEAVELYPAEADSAALFFRSLGRVCCQPIPAQLATWLQAAPAARGTLKGSTRRQLQQLLVEGVCQLP